MAFESALFYAKNLPALLLSFRFEECEIFLFLSRKNLCCLLLPLCLLSACYDPVENYKPTSFKAENVNEALNSRLVEIVSIMPAEALIDNSYNHYMAADWTGVAFGSLFGLTGIVLGMDGMATGWYLGNSFGQVLGGFMIPPALYPKSLVLSYKDPLEPEVKQVVEIARPCEFKIGTAYAVLVKSHGHLETRLQPNHIRACEEKIKALKADEKEGIAYQLTQEDMLDQIQIDSDRFVPPVGEAVILRLSNPKYHSPYEHFKAESKSAKPAKKVQFTAKQLRKLRRHKVLQEEEMIHDITPPAPPAYKPEKAGRAQWEYMNSFGQGV
ncbi:hypothetical protein FAI40_03895 [Acetobacteraceae bacterium]|nr:hypothetical protein FAI40_03895 [Acetobacteraceae bacterium]